MPERLVEDHPVRGERVGAVGVGEVDLELGAHRGSAGPRSSWDASATNRSWRPCGRLGPGDEPPDEDPEGPAEHERW